jgi:hypothetical protein
MQIESILFYLFYFIIVNRKSAVDIATMLRAELSAIRISAAANNFSLLKNVHTGSGAHFDS